MIEIVQVVPEQKESCAAASATPPGDSGPMFRVMLLSARRT